VVVSDQKPQIAASNSISSQSYKLNNFVMSYHVFVVTRF